MPDIHIQSTLARGGRGKLNGVTLSRLILRYWEYVVNSNKSYSVFMLTFGRKKSFVFFMYNFTYKRKTVRFIGELAMAYLTHFIAYVSLPEQIDYKLNLEIVFVDYFDCLRLSS